MIFTACVPLGWGFLCCCDRGRAEVHWGLLLHVEPGPRLDFVPGGPGPRLGTWGSSPQALRTIEPCDAWTRCLGPFPSALGVPGSCRTTLAMPCGHDDLLHQ